MDGIEPFLADVLALAGEEPDAIRDEVRVALGDLLDGFVLTLLLAVAIGESGRAPSKSSAPSVDRCVRARLRWRYARSVS
jgi:hypothetical protein